MSSDFEEQEDELLALKSIFGSEEFVRHETKSAGEIRVCAELPTGFAVALREGDTLRQYEISFLPPLLLTFELPEDYPSSSPPSFTLTCSWLTCNQLSALRVHLIDLYKTTGGSVVLFSWVQFLREEALCFLDISSLLELPSDEQNIFYTSDHKPNAALSEPQNNHHALTTGSTDEQNSDVLVSCKTGLPLSSLKDQDLILADSQNSSASDWSNADSHGALALDSGEDEHKQSKPDWISRDDQNAISVQTKQIHNEIISDPDKTEQNISNSAKASDFSEAEQIPQISEHKADLQNDLSSEAGKPGPLFDQSNLSVKAKDHDVSASLPLPSASAVPSDQSEQAAADLTSHLRDSIEKKDQTFSRLPLAPAQALLSQLLVYNEAQRQKVFATSMFDCSVCFMPWLGSECVQLWECGHVYCQSCLAQYCKVQIAEGNVRGVTCPQPGCTATPTPAQVKMLVGEELFSRYDRLLLQSSLDSMADVVYCPRRACGSAVILEKGSRAALCFVCSYAFCVSCRKIYHGIEDCHAKKKNMKKQKEKKGEEEEEEEEESTDHAFANTPQTQAGVKALWDDYSSSSRERKRLLESRYGRYQLRSMLVERLSEDWVVNNSKYCPHCYFRIEKDGGCNVMTCSLCRRLFCWLCLARLPAYGASAHFSETTCSHYTYHHDHP